MKTVRRTIGTAFLLVIALPLAVVFDILVIVGNIGNHLVGRAAKATSEFME